MKRKVIAPVAAVVAGACVAGGGLVKYDDWRNEHKITVGNPVTLTGGTAAGGQSWTLQAGVERNRFLRHQERLCLSLMAGRRQTGGGCEYDARPSGSFWDFSQGPGSSFFLLGPVPANATSVRIVYPHRVDRTVTTRPLPALHGVPTGRYFVIDADPTGSIAADGDGAGRGDWWTVTPLDSSGHAVPFTVF
ncbi:hypothetical protein BTM25_35530 [Actinomadura rubteroloni]|uniref:Uncharacterized protein n=2 Tax=Actinomadura rubteroloni TaxID=1926885 RepID=A0A2P4UIM8_9ACTN|nr:hypothetical protein BTM25_35530 [Actinomadura rubteroloni]